MTALLLVPLVLPFLVPALARRTLDRSTPVTALWVLTTSALALAGACVAALGALVLTGLLELPAFAALGELVRPLRTPSDFVLPAAVAAIGVLTVSAWTLARSALRQARAFTARTQADRRPAAGNLCVIDSPHPDAYALPDVPTASSSPARCCAASAPPNAKPSSPTSAPTTGPATTTSWPPPNSPPTAIPHCAPPAPPSGSPPSGQPTRPRPSPSATAV